MGRTPAAKSSTATGAAPAELIRIGLEGATATATPVGGHEPLTGTPAPQPDRAWLERVGRQLDPEPEANVVAGFVVARFPPGFAAHPPACVARAPVVPARSAETS